VNRFRKLALVGEGVSVLSLIAFTIACGSSSSQVRVFDVYPNVSNVDMLINNKTIASGVAYGTASAYASASSGSQNLIVEASGSTSPLINQTISLGSGSSTILATGSGAVAIADNNSAPGSGNIKIRVINASPTLGTADVYVVTSGTSISGLSPTFSNLNYQSASSYQSLAAGSYQVIFTQPGQQFPELSTSSLSFSAGQVRTAVALDAQGGGFTTAILSDLN